jgi:hypothetical protein
LKTEVLHKNEVLQTHQKEVSLNSIFSYILSVKETEEFTKTLFFMKRRVLMIKTNWGIM